MKTAVSIPDDVYHRAERLARKMNPKDSVANGSAVTALDKRILIERVGRLADAKLNLILSGIDVVLGRAIK